MAYEDTEILEDNLYQKSDEIPFIIYADLECKIEKIDGYKTNPENSSTRKRTCWIRFFNVYNIAILKQRK